MKKQFLPLLAAFTICAFSALSLLAQPLPHHAPAPNGTPTPEPTEIPTVTSTPTPAPSPTAVLPKPVPTKRGETRRAELLAKKAVQVDAELLEETELTTLSARFTVAPDGTATAALLGSSGSRRVDAVVLNQIKSWRFRPALEDGKAVASTIKLRVEFGQS